MMSKKAGSHSHAAHAVKAQKRGSQGGGRLKARILADLKEKVRTGIYPAGGLLPSEAELASHYLASRGTVRLVLLELAAQGIVQRSPGKGTFVRSLQPGPAQPRPAARLVGFVAPSEKDWLVADILHGAEQVLREKNYNLVFYSAKSDVHVELNQFQDMLSHSVSGMIVFPMAERDEETALRSLVEAGMPLVLVDRHIPGIRTAAVMADHRQGAYQGIQYLLSLGHRRIACISHPSTSSSVLERIQGYEQAMREAGCLPLATIPLLGLGTMVAENVPPVFSDAELAYVGHMLAVEERPTAIFCINDYAAIRVSQYILSRGLRIPEDIAVLGFDNNPFAAFAPVPLTTLSQPAVEIGVKAAQILLQKIAGEPVPDDTLRLPAPLVVRESTARASFVITNQER